jgi:DNA-directed RNA polymerase specialized sigma24 family protein
MPVTQTTSSGGDDTTIARGFVPDEAWIDAFKAQCTEEMRLQAKRFALRQLRGIGKLGRPVGDDDAKDLVQDAIVDTLAGVLSWDPAKPLKLHIEDAIVSRARREYKREKKHRHERMDTALVPGRDTTTLRAEVEASLQDDHEDGDAAELLISEELLGRIREAAAGDKLAVRFVDAVADGARNRAEIMEHARMSEKTYRNARARLRRLVDKLDQQMGAALWRA